MNIGTHFLETALFEYRALKRLAEKALAQVGDDAFFHAPSAESNSIAIIIRHVTGSMISRFTDFLTTDGEKPNRNRDTEFDGPPLSRQEIMERWESGWNILFGSVEPLTADDMLRTITIRGEQFTVVQALARQLTHYGNHVGQIIYLAKMLAGDSWQTLTIARGKSEAWKSVQNPEQSYFKR